MSRKVYQPRQLDQEIFSLLKKMNYNFNIIYDVGGSDGCWSQSIHDIFPSAKYYLFEPLADSEKYNKNLSTVLENHPSFELHKYALGEKEEEITIKIFPDSVSSTTLPFSSDSIDYQEVKISCLTIEGAIKKFNLPVPNVIKIDTQGSELAILKGAKNILSQVDVLLLELWLYRGYGEKTPLLTEVVDWLLPFNFRLWDIGDEYRNDDGILGTLDCVFINTQKDIAPSWY